jgi:hypothetical protein
VREKEKNENGVGLTCRTQAVLVILWPAAFMQACLWAAGRNARAITTTNRLTLYWQVRRLHDNDKPTVPTYIHLCDYFSLIYDLHDNDFDLFGPEPVS